MEDFSQKLRSLVKVERVLGTCEGSAGRSIPVLCATNLGLQALRDVLHQSAVSRRTRSAMRTQESPKFDKNNESSLAGVKKQTEYYIPLGKGAISNAPKGL